MSKTLHTCLLPLLVLFILSGCQRRIIEESSTLPEPSSPPESSSEAESIPSEAEPMDDPFQDISFSAYPGVPGSVVVSYSDPDSDSLLFFNHFFWTDPSHIYLPPEQQEGNGVLVDAENQSLEQVPGYGLYSWDNIAYQDDGILRILSGGTIIKFDRNLNLLSSYQPKEPESHDDVYYISSIHLPSEAVYYIQQNDPEKPLFWRQKGEQAEIAAELPPLRQGESYTDFSVSPSGNKLFFCRQNGLRVNCIFFYDLEAQSVLAATTRPGWENYPAGFFLPRGIWMGEQPVFFVDHEYRDRVQSLAGLNSIELLYGIPLESKAEIFQVPDKESNWAYLSMNGLNIESPSPWNCIEYTAVDRKNNTELTEIVYIRDNETYLSYTVPITSEHTVYFPQVSPDFSYLAYVLYDDELGSRLCIIPTDTLWNPLDWQKLQAEFEKMNHEFLDKNQS